MVLEGDLTAVVDDAVEFSFTVSNAGTTPVQMQFADGLLADVAAYDGEEEVWRWSDDRAFTQAVGTESLLPGESFTHEVEWTDPDPGEYTAVATLAATNVSVDATTTVRISR